MPGRAEWVTPCRVKLSPRALRNAIVGCGLALLVEPLAQTAAGPGPQGYRSLLAPLSEELDDRGGTEAHVGAP